MIKRLVNLAKAIYRDEKGADMVEYILIFAAVSLPIIAVILIYRDKLTEKISTLWSDVFTD